MPPDTLTITDKVSTNPTGKEEIVVLLCGPKHDVLTAFTSRLLEDFAPLGPTTKLCQFDSPLTYEQLLTKLSIDPEATKVAMVFCGHGTNTSLQGPGAAPGAQNYSALRSDFYGGSYLHLGPTLMLAACCSAAMGLGRSFRLKTEGCTFIGFDDLIAFVAQPGVYAEWWGKILHSIATAMLETTDIYELRDRVQQAYKNAILFFDPLRNKERYALLMRAYMRKQLENIDFIRTE